jgi:uncharacterized protein YbjT (DUF2867 family)
MNHPGKSAIILGATGLTGDLLLGRLLDDPRYARIILFSRSTVGLQNPKIQEHLVDVLNLEDQKVRFQADEVYCCIGTTRARTSDKKKYKAIDYGIPVSAARLCKANGIRTFIVISSLGANPSSSLFYSRIKGEMEQDVIRVGLPKTHILQPSLIGGKRKERRFGEWVAKQFMNALRMVMVGSLKKYRAVPPGDIALSMVWLANNVYGEIRIESDEISRLATL